MQTFLTWIDWGENEILRWVRVLVISSFGLLLIVGVLVLLISLLRISVWPSVTIDDDTATIRFSVPSTSEQGESSPHSRIRPLQALVLESQRYQDEVDGMIERLTPLYTSLGLSSIKRQDIEKYIHDVIGSLISIMAEHLPSSREERLERLDTAVENMAEYVEEMADYYTEALSEDGENLNLKGRLQQTMRTPLQEYNEAFANAVTELVKQAEDEQRRVTVARASGLAGFWVLSIIGILLMTGIPLLVLFRLDAILQARLGDSQSSNNDNL